MKSNSLLDGFFKKKRYSTSVNIPRNSFLIGMGSIFDISGNYFSTGKAFSPRSDWEALESDWGVIGQDIKATTRKLSPKK